jgi:hypothetical protein
MNNRIMRMCKARKGVKLPALPRGASVAKPSETALKQLDLISTEAQPAFALMATARSPVAIAQRRRLRRVSSPCFRTGHPGEGE